MAKSAKPKLKDQQKTMKVKVVVAKFGNYKKGETLDMHPSTAAACIKSGTVEKVGKTKED